MKVIDGSITAPQGFMAQGACAEIKKKNKMDVGIIYSTNKSQAAGVYTTNIVRAACIDICKKNLADGTAQAIVVNSGNANACTGEQGRHDALEMTKATAQILGIDPQDVLVASTGVIGEFLPMKNILVGIDAAAHNLSESGAENVAAAIMTTDLFPKEVAVEFEIDSCPVRIGAIAKGSGMIHPNMATLLGFITTDADIDSACLSACLQESVNRSYNMISVDRDTSTNDAVLILANAQAGNNKIDYSNPEGLAKFQKALDFVNIKLAKMIARDGEGANHLIEVQVVNAEDVEKARKIARSVISSNLVKAAVFGGDANWGRIICAMGYSGAEFDQNKVDIYLGEVKVAQDGCRYDFSEELAHNELLNENIIIKIDLNAGEHKATAWGCDLSYDYVKINADYRS